MTHHHTTSAVIYHFGTFNGLEFWAVHRQSSLINDSYIIEAPTTVTDRSPTVYSLRMPCMASVRDPRTGHWRTCGIQTSTLYTRSFDHPEEPTYCPHHYLTDAPATYSKSMSFTINQMCELVGISRQARENNLTLQHLNAFMNQPIKTKTQLLTSMWLRGVVEANFSASMVRRIYQRSKETNAIVLYTIDEMDGDTSGDFIPLSIKDSLDEDAESTSSKRLHETDELPIPSKKMC